jgi:hypothetical protein
MTTPIVGLSGTLVCLAVARPLTQRLVRRNVSASVVWRF